MKIDKYGRIVLSRRNLLSLLHKLDMPGSVCTLIAPGGAFVVHAEEDDKHYMGRQVGKMHPETEDFIKSHGRKAPEVQEGHEVSAQAVRGVDSPRRVEAGAVDVGPVSDC